MKFTRLPLTNLQTLNSYDNNTVTSDLLRAKTRTPRMSSLNIHTPPQIIGDFNATARVEFSETAISKINRINPDLIKEVLFKHYDLESYTYDESLDKIPSWTMLEYLSFPLHLLNLWPSFPSRLIEATEKTSALLNLVNAKTPLEVQSVVSSIQDAKYPLKLVSSLFQLCNENEIPREIKFYINPHSKTPAHIRRIIEKLNSSPIVSESPFESDQLYHISQDKKEAFTPGASANIYSRPIIEQVNISQLILPSSKPAIKVNLVTKGLSKNKTSKIYVRVEKGGRVDIGKFVLGKKVIRIPTKEHLHEADTTQLSFFLTGPQTIFPEWIFTKTFALGGSFKIVIGISQDEAMWSTTKEYLFNYEDSKLNYNE